MCELCFSFLFFFGDQQENRRVRSRGTTYIFSLLWFKFLWRRNPRPRGTLCFYYSVFPGLGWGLDPEWRWLSVTCNFLLMKKKKTCNFACSVFLLCDTVWELGLSAGRTVSCQSCLPVTKGKCNATLSPGWLRVASQAHRFSDLSRRAHEVVTSLPQEPPSSTKQCVLKSDKQCVTLWRYVKKKKKKKNNWLLWKNDSSCRWCSVKTATFPRVRNSALWSLFGRLCVWVPIAVNSEVLAEKRQCFMSSPLHIFLHIRWRACDLSGMGNICAYCHTGMKAFYCL